MSLAPTPTAAPDPRAAAHELAGEGISLNGIALGWMDYMDDRIDRADPDGQRAARFPMLRRLGEVPLFLGATVLTAFNDNALITYLATLVPDLSDPLKAAVVEGAVLGGGLTVIANAPNPAGQALLSRFFDGAVSPLKLFVGALLPTLIAGVLFRIG